MISTMKGMIDFFRELTTPETINLLMVLVMFNKFILLISKVTIISNNTTTAILKEKTSEMH